MTEWLRLRHRLWPHTSNSHVLVTHVTAAGTAPVSTFFLRWNLGLQDIPLDHLRADRVLHEALAAAADLLHLAAAFRPPSSTPTLPARWSRARSRTIRSTPGAELWRRPDRRRAEQAARSRRARSEPGTVGARSAMRLRGSHVGSFTNAELMVFRLGVIEESDYALRCVPAVEDLQVLRRVVGDLATTQE
jgi:hypothetical protein